MATPAEQAGSISTVDDFFRAVLADLGLPATSQNLVFLRAWANAEGTSAKNNPLATTLSVNPAQESQFNSVGVKNYATPQLGAQATADTIRGGYSGIITALRSGNAVYSSFGNTAVYSDLNKWSTGTPSPTLSSYVRNVITSAQGGSGGSLSAADIGSVDLGGAASAAGSAAKNLPGVQQAVGLYDATVSTGKFLGQLLNPSFWLRALQIVAGASLIGMGLFLLAKQVGLATPNPALLAAEL